MGPVHGAVVQVQQAGAAQLTQQDGVQAGQTPTSVQSRSRRQAVTPEQPTASAGTSRQATPVRSTYMTPASAARSGTRNRPG